MKHNLVASPFFLCILLSFFFSSCNYNNTRELTPSPFTKKVDSLYKFYDIAFNNTNPKIERLNAINSFLRGTQQLGIDSLEHKGLSLYAKLLNKYSGPEKAIEQSYILLQRAKQDKDSIYIGKALYRLGYYNKITDNYLKAFNYYNQSYKIYRNIKDNINAGRSLLAMSNIQRTLGDYNACTTTATDGLKYVEKSTEYRIIVGLYHNISMSFLELSNFKEALAWNDKALNLTVDSLILKKIGFHPPLIIKNTRAIILARQKKYQESINILEFLLENENVTQKQIRYAQVLSNLGYFKYQQDSLNLESETMLLEALGIREEKKSTLGIFHSNIQLTKYYKKKNKERAKHHAYKAYETIKDFGDYASLLEVLTLITELNPNSLQDHQRFKEASLNLMELRRKTREIYAPTRFENENLLKENARKNKRISEVRNQNTVYLLSILLLLTGIGFVVYFFRQQMRYLNHQSKIGQFQASYETETRISKRLHDELGNDIFQVMLQYQNNPHDPNIKEKLNTTYHKARDISRENNEFETGESYVEELNNMLHNYTHNGIRLIVIGFANIDWQHKDKTVKITVYRVLQELMTNMQKHSKATLVKLIFSSNKNTLMIKYSDNGVGMDTEDTKSKNGLGNTEKRIEAIGGTLIFDSSKDKGFKAEIQIPN